MYVWGGGAEGKGRWSIVETGLGVGQPTFNKAFLKNSIAVDCRILLSSLFESAIVDGKKE